MPWQTGELLVGSRAEPQIRALELFDAPPELTLVTRERDFLGTLDVALACDRRAAQIRYTLDGSEPTSSSPVCQGMLHLDTSCTLRARAYQGERAGVLEVRADFRCWRPDSLLPAIQFIRRPDAGLARTRYAGARTSLAGLSQASPTDVENVAGFDVSDAGENVACAFRGNLEVPADGLWTLTTKSDDGSRLFLDGQLVVDNDGLHGLQEQSGTIGLKAGWHALELQWFNADGGAGLEVSWLGPGTGRQPLPAERLGR